MADGRRQRRGSRRSRAGGRRALLAALLLLGGVAAAASLALSADRLGWRWRGGRARPRGPRGSEAHATARQARAEGEGETRPPTADTFGVQQEPGDARDPRAFGETGQLAEAIETGVRGQGGGPRLRETNAIIFPSESSREGGVYVQDFNSKGPDGAPVCELENGGVCEVAPDLFSRAGLVWRGGVDNRPGVNREAMSLETQHTCVCVDSACRHIAELRVVDVYEDEDALAAREPREHACVLRRRKGRATFTGCAQSLLVAKKQEAEAMKNSIVASESPVERGLANGKFPRTVETWDFEFEMDEVEWNAHGYRGYVNVMMADEYDALPKENLERDGMEVDYDVLRSPLSEDETEWVAHENATVSSLCAETAKWALHAAAHQATALNDLGRGVEDSVFVEVLPPRASGTERALSIGQALVSLATLYLLLTEVYIEMTKMQDEKHKEKSGVTGIQLLPGIGGGRGLRRRRGLMTLICKWPVWLMYGAGLILLGLEMIAIGVVWTAELDAVRALGRFVHASFVAAIARDTGDAPFLIDERGNVIIVTLLVGTARYTSSTITSLSVVLPICLVLGAAAIVVAVCPVLVWHRFFMHEVSKGRKESSSDAAVPTIGAVVQREPPPPLQGSLVDAHAGRITAGDACRVLLNDERFSTSISDRLCGHKLLMLDVERGGVAADCGLEIGGVMVHNFWFKNLHLPTKLVKVRDEDRQKVDQCLAEAKDLGVIESKPAILVAIEAQMNIQGEVTAWQDAGRQMLMALSIALLEQASTRAKLKRLGAELPRMDCEHKLSLVMNVVFSVAPLAGGAAAGAKRAAFGMALDLIESMLGCGVGLQGAANPLVVDRIVRQTAAGIGSWEALPFEARKSILAAAEGLEMTWEESCDMIAKANDVVLGQGDRETGADDLNGVVVELVEGEVGGSDEARVSNGLEQVERMLTVNVGRTEADGMAGEAGGDRWRGGYDTVPEKSCALEDGSAATSGETHETNWAQPTSEVGCTALSTNRRLNLRELDEVRRLDEEQISSVLAAVMVKSNERHADHCAVIQDALFRAFDQWFVDGKALVDTLGDGQALEIAMRSLNDDYECLAMERSARTVLEGRLSSYLVRISISVCAARGAVSLGTNGGGRVASRSSGEAHANSYSTLETEVLAVQKTCVLGREGTTIRDPLEGSVTCILVDTELDVYLSPSSPGTLYGPSSYIDTSRRIISDKPAEFLHRSPAAVRLGPHLAAAAAGYALLIHVAPSASSNPATLTQMVYTPSIPVSHVYAEYLVDNVAYFWFVATYEGAGLQPTVALQQREHRLVYNQLCGFSVHGHEPRPAAVYHSDERLQQHQHKQQKSEHQRQHQQKQQKKQHRKTLQRGQNRQHKQHEYNQLVVLLPSEVKRRKMTFPGHRNGACDVSGPEGTCNLWSFSEGVGLRWDEYLPRTTYLCSAFAKRIELRTPREFWHEPRSLDSAKTMDLFQRALDGRGKCAARSLVLVSDIDKIVSKDMSKSCEPFWCATYFVKRLATELESRWLSGRFLEPWRFVFFGDEVPPEWLSWLDARQLWFKGEHPPHGCSASAATPERSSCECGPPAILSIDDGDAFQPQGSTWSGTRATGSSSGEDQGDNSGKNGLAESGDGTGISSGEDRNDDSILSGLPRSQNGKGVDESDKAADEEQRKRRLKWATKKQEQRARLRQDPLKLAASRKRDRERKRDSALRKVAGEVIDDVCSRRPAREKPPDRASPQSHGQVVHHSYGSHLQEQVVSCEQELEQPREIAHPRRLDSILVQTPEQQKIADLERENEQLRQEIRHLRQENKQVRQENTDLRKDNEQKGPTVSTLFHALADVMKGPGIWKTICPLFNREELPGPSAESSNPSFSGVVGGSRHNPCAQYSTPAKYPDPSPRTRDTGSNAFESGAASAGTLSAGGYDPAACRNKNLGYACLSPERSSCYFQDEIQGAALNLSGSMATPRATHSQARAPQCEAHDHSAGRPSAAPSLDLGFGETADGSGHAHPQDLTPTPYQLAAPMITPMSQMAGDAIAAPLSTPEIIPSPAPVEAFWRQSWSEPLRGPQDLESPRGDYDDDDDDDDYGDVDEIFRFP